jgi:hypothetical protein
MVKLGSPKPLRTPPFHPDAADDSADTSAEVIPAGVCSRTTLPHVQFLMKPATAVAPLLQVPLIERLGRRSCGGVGPVL